MRPKGTANPADCLRCAKWAESRAFPGVRAVSPVHGRAFRAGAILDGGRTSLPLSRPKILTRGADLAAGSSVRILDDGRTSLQRSRPKSAMLLRARGQGRAVRFWTGAVLHSACGVQKSGSLVFGRSPYLIPHKPSKRARASFVCLLRGGVRRRPQKPSQRRAGAVWCTLLLPTPCPAHLMFEKTLLPTVSP